MEYLFVIFIFASGICIGRKTAKEDAYKMGYFDYWGSRYSVSNVGKLNAKGQVDRS